MKMTTSPSIPGGVRQPYALFGLDLIMNLSVTNFDEAPDVDSTVVNNSVAKTEEIHSEMGDYVFDGFLKWKMTFLQLCYDQDCMKVMKLYVNYSLLRSNTSKNTELIIISV